MAEERERATERCQRHSRKKGRADVTSTASEEQRERASSGKEWTNENKWRKKKGLIG